MEICMTQQHSFVQQNSFSLDTLDSNLWENDLKKEKAL